MSAERWQSRAGLISCQAVPLSSHACMKDSDCPVCACVHLVLHCRAANALHQLLVCSYTAASILLFSISGCHSVVVVSSLCIYTSAYQLAYWRMGVHVVSSTGIRGALVRTC